MEAWRQEAWSFWWIGQLATNSSIWGIRSKPPTDGYSYIYIFIWMFDTKLLKGLFCFHCYFVFDLENILKPIYPSINPSSVSVYHIVWSSFSNIRASAQYTYPIGCFVYYILVLHVLLVIVLCRFTMTIDKSIVFRYLEKRSTDFGKSRPVLCNSQKQSTSSKGSRLFVLVGEKVNNLLKSVDSFCSTKKNSQLCWTICKMVVDFSWCMPKCDKIALDSLNRRNLTWDVLVRKVAYIT